MVVATTVPADALHVRFQKRSSTGLPAETVMLQQMDGPFDTDDTPLCGVHVLKTNPGRSVIRRCDPRKIEQSPERRLSNSEGRTYHGRGWLITTDY